MSWGGVQGRGGEGTPAGHRRYSEILGLVLTADLVLLDHPRACEIVPRHLTVAVRQRLGLGVAVR